MQVYNNNRGEVSQIVDHKVKPLAMNGKEEKTLHFQVEWFAENSEASFSWEPITRLYRDVPDMVIQYCQVSKLNITDVLDKEAERRKPNFWKKYQNNQKQNKIMNNPYYMRTPGSSQDNPRRSNSRSKSKSKP